MCTGGVATWKRSRSVSPSAAIQCSTACPKLRCVWRTALGKPVVPGAEDEHGVGVGIFDDRRAIERRRRRRVRRSRATAPTGARPPAARHPAASPIASLRRHDPAGVLHLGGLPRRAEHHDRRARAASAPYAANTNSGRLFEHQRDACAAGRRRRAASARAPVVGAGLQRRRTCNARSSKSSATRSRSLAARLPQHLGQRPPVRPVVHGYRSSRRGSRRVASIVVPISCGSRLDDPSRPSSTSARLT